MDYVIYVMNGEVNMTLLPDYYANRNNGKFMKWFKSVARTNQIVLDFFDETKSRPLWTLDKRHHYKLLDIGAWDGSMAKLLDDWIEYYPLDIAKIDHPNAIQMDLNEGELPFKDKYFDYVIADQVIEHTFFPIQICKEIHRVLKDDGKAMIGLPNELSLIARLSFLLRGDYGIIEDQEFQHHWYFTLSNSEKMLKDCGFKIIKKAGRFGITHPILLKVSPINFYKVIKS